MNIKKIFSLFVCAAMVFSVMPFSSSAEDFDGEYIEGEAIFEYTQTLSSENSFLNSQNIPQELTDIGITSVRELDVDKVFDTGVKTNADGTKTKTGYFVGYFDDDVISVCNKLNALESVDLAMPSKIMETDAVTIPTEVVSPTNLYNTYTKWWFEDDLEIPTAWEEFDTLGEGVVVAVLDAGFTLSNPEYTGRIWEDAAGNQGYNAVTKTTDVTADTPHGDNVASIIVGAAGYNYSVIGVAPEAQIMPIKVSKKSNTITIDSVVEGINYAISNCADIISMSVSTSAGSGVTALLLPACEAAYDAGIILCASAGNNSQNASENLRYPAAFDCVIGVMANGSDGQLCDFSNYDPTLEYYNIVAPGYKILGISSAGLTAYQGTSQATPIVSGLAALYRSVYPDHTPEEFFRSLANSSTDIVQSNPEVVTDTTYEFPVVNAMNLLNYPNVKPSLEAIVGSTAVVDNERSFIYGIEENYTSLESYIGVNDGSYSTIPTDNGYGTGTIVRVFTNTGQVFRDYEIVIFGDTDGDAKCDGRDTLLCDFAVSGGAVPDCIAFACDVDFDNSVTETDSGIISRCGVFTDFVSQIR